MGIQDNIRQFIEGLDSNVKLVAVSKTKSVGEILEAYHSGHKIFGENRIQELVYKAGELPKDIQWHMVGHLQTNKVKYIAPFIHLIHSIDSVKLLNVINKEAHKNDRIIDGLLQIHIAREETKFGLSEEEAIGILESTEYQQMRNIRLTGLMGMATFTDDMDGIRKEFRFLAGVFHRIKKRFFSEKPWFCELSMGMSGDYQIAIEEGSTLIRVGTLIFGERNKH